MFKSVVEVPKAICKTFSDIIVSLAALIIKTDISPAKTQFTFTSVTVPVSVDAFLLKKCNLHLK